MADMTSTAANSAIAGAGAITMALLGLPPGTLFCGFVGAGFGVTTTAPTGRWRTMWMFAFAMFAGAFFGTWAAAAFFGGDGLATKGLALVLASMAVPAQSVIVGQLEPFVRSWADKLRPKP